MAVCPWAHQPTQGTFIIESKESGSACVLTAGQKRGTNHHLTNTKRKIMSDLIINIRFFYHHLQVRKNFRGITFSRNKSIDTLKGLKKIEVFKFF
jgi:hypothetical protein